MLHVVLFKLNPEKMAAVYPGNALEEDVDTLRHGGIPGLRDIQFKPKDSAPWDGYVDGSHGFTHALVSRHDSAETLRIYAEHPLHRAVQARMAPCVEGPPLRIELRLTNSEP